MQPLQKLQAKGFKDKGPAIDRRCSVATNSALARSAPLVHVCIQEMTMTCIMVILNTVLRIVKSILTYVFDTEPSSLRYVGRSTLLFADSCMSKG